jgi:hypothetical protein
MLREIHVSDLLLQNVNKIFNLLSFGMFTVKHLKEVQRFWLDKWFEKHDTVLKKMPKKFSPRKKSQYANNSV